LPQNLGRWLKEITSKQARLTTKVVYIHTKLLLINPLSDDPIVISGSANFSPNSMHSSDENMLIIRGNTRVADIYLSEYMRIFNHYRFRARFKLDPNTPSPDPAAGTTPDQTLATTPAWTSSYYDPNDPGRYQEPLLFSG